MTPAAPLPELAFLRTEKSGDVLVEVHVVPNAARTQAAGLHGEFGRQALRLRLQAPPVDGKANAELIGLVAREFGCAKSAIEIATGAGARIKRVRIPG
jgi:uncharacterized protein (TIGR00251 family)